MEITKALVAEFIGTLGLVLGGCGAAVLAADFGSSSNTTSLGIGSLGVALAFGFAMATGAFAFGHVSGAHFNPAVTIGLVAGGRFQPSRAVPYVVVQLLGAVAGAIIIWVIASGQPGWETGSFAANGYGELSPGGFGLGAAFVAEVVLSAMFLIIIMGATTNRAPGGSGPIASGLMLALIHLVSIPVTNTSVNPARSTSQAIFAGADYLAQLWLFWLAPIVGAVIGGAVYRYVVGAPDDVVVG